MEKTAFAKAQYNGLIVFASYIYRLFVQQSIAVQLKDEETKDKADVYNTMLEDVAMVTAMFEQTKDLTIGQHQKLMQIYEQVHKVFPSFFVEEPATFTQKVAIVSASFYGERHLNEKIIHLGQLFNVKVSTDFERGIAFYNERVKLMDFVTLALSKGDELQPELIQQIETWYANVISIKDHVLSDLEKVPALLSGGKQ